MGSAQSGGLTGREAAELQGAITKKRVTIEKEEENRQALQEEQRTVTALNNSLRKQSDEIGFLKDKLWQLENERKSIQPSAASSPANQKEYLKKLEDFNKKQEELQKQMRQTFKASVEQVSSKFFNGTCETACADRETLVMKCYMDNPKKTLNCSHLVKDFVQCVNERRNENLVSKA